ncbi:hypothetical protein JCM19239_5466 [Vibrio variabilis]|uniref:Uncharacterized protein n=1 Tax=Vibrio variabilis TaxID=990271 RepID=A0ABQ0JHH3_9VIBR|nr:hypothetical protein JCM19239_5466 [Vibrio variabilis]
MSPEAGFSILEQNAFDASALVGDTSNLSKEVWRRDKLVGPMSVLFYQQPVELVRGEGVWLYDHQARPIWMPTTTFSLSDTVIRMLLSR